MKNFWKSRSILIIFSAAIVLSVVLLINYTIDPFWSFQHVVPIGRYQPMFDERQQKTNYILFRDLNFDTVIFGNSRVTYMNPLTVPGSAFNYSASSMKPDEFLPYLRFVASKSLSPIKKVILGLSFVDSNATSRPAFDPPELYIRKAQSWGFRYKSLANLALLRYSLGCVQRDFSGNYHDSYVRSGHEISSKQMSLPVPPGLHKKEIDENVSVFRARAYGKSYVYLDNRQIYFDLKNSFPAARFYVFTTPVSAHLLELLVEQGLFESYIEWIRGMVDVFGEVWHFMYFNEVTMNDDNYKDAHHYSPQVCDVITRKMFGIAENEIGRDFGIKITRENIEYYVSFLEKNMKNP